MSRIGKKPIAVPAGVKVSHDRASRTVQIEGPKGKMSYSYHPDVTVEWSESDKKITCTVPDDRQEAGQTRANWGSTRARLQTMVNGVTTGYTEKLELIGVGWSVRVQGKNLVLAVGFCNPIEMPLPAGVTCVVENNLITISGFDRQAVGQFAAEVRSRRKPEPYNGKGIKYQAETIQRKQGKAFGA